MKTLQPGKTYDMDLTHPRRNNGLFLPFAIDSAAPFADVAGSIALRLGGETGVSKRGCSCCDIFLSLSGCEAADFRLNLADCGFGEIVESDMFWRNGIMSLCRITVK